MCSPESCMSCEQGRRCPDRIALQLHRLQPESVRAETGQVCTCAELGFTCKWCAMKQVREVPQLTEAQKALHTGMRKSGLFTVENAAKLYAPSEAATERSDWIGRIALVAAGAAAALLTAATVFHH